MRSAITVVWIALSFIAAADKAAGADVRPAPGARGVCHPIEIFTRDNCGQCEAAEKFLGELARRRRDVRLTRLDVVKDPPSLKRFTELCRQHRIQTVGVPGVLVGNQLFVGYKDDETTGLRIEESLTIEAFTRAGCPHCAKAREFLHELSTRHPGLRIVVHDVMQDATALKRMQDLAARHRVQVPNLPLIRVYGRLIVGFRDAESSGREIETLVRSATIVCPEPGVEADVPRREAEPMSIAPKHDEMGLVRGLWGPWCAGLQSTMATYFVAVEEPEEIVPEAIPAIDEAPAVEAAEPLEVDLVPESPPDEIKVPLFGTLRVSTLGLPVFTFLLGLVDGFNPCAMWILIFLLSLLVNLKDRRKIVLIAGTFVAVSGLAYFAFMAAWLNVFVLIGFARWAQIALGLLATAIGAVNVKDFYAFKRGVSFSIPESAKPEIYARVRQIASAKYMTAAVTGAVVLAVLVNILELLCTAGLPALYTQILTFHELPWWKNYAYLALYNVAYMLDDSIMLTVAVVTLSHRKLQEREGRWLKLVSGLVILGLGLLLLFKPDWLS